MNILNDEPQPKNENRHEKKEEEKKKWTKRDYIVLYQKIKS